MSSDNLLSVTLAATNLPQLVQSFAPSDIRLPQFMQYLIGFSAPCFNDIPAELLESNSQSEHKSLMGKMGSLLPHSLQCSAILMHLSIQETKVGLTVPI